MNETKSYKNFQLFLTDIFAKKYFKILKKQFDDFSKFGVLGHFDLQIDLKIQIWPHPPNIIWGCPFKFYFGTFEFMFLTFGIYNFVKLSKLCQIPTLYFEQSLFLLYQAVLPTGHF